MGFPDAERACGAVLRDGPPARRAGIRCGPPARQAEFLCSTALVVRHTGPATSCGASPPAEAVLRLGLRPTGGDPYARSHGWIQCCSLPVSGPFGGGNLRGADARKWTVKIEIATTILVLSTNTSTTTWISGIISARCRKNCRGRPRTGPESVTSSTPFEGCAPGTFSNGRRLVPGAEGGEPLHCIEFARVMD